MSASARAAGSTLRADEVFAALARETRVLKSFGVSRLALFGSVVRGEAQSNSDLDFVVDFDRKTFRNYMGLADFLERLFGRRVDLVIRGSIKPLLRDKILREARDVPGL